jgi:geranylgeranyl reductase family protein
MSESSTYDVIIVGAGPAGALLAYLLASRNARVLLIDKRHLPREKPCGGALTPRALTLLPFDIGEVVEEYAYSVEAFVNGKPAFVTHRDRPLITMVMRSRLDHFLAVKAVRAGATLEDGVNFKAFHPSGDGLNIHTSEGIFKGRLLVGADGVNSRVARALGLKVRRHVMNAVEGEIYYPDSVLPRIFQNTAHFDFGLIPEGYGWIFPKRDHLSVGVLSASRRVKRLKPYFNAYLAAKNIHASANVKYFMAHLIPVSPDKRNILATEKGLLVGDAAGFADPITGEGMTCAFKGAHIASRVIMVALRSGNKRLEAYTPILRKEMGHDLNFAKRFAYILYKCPRFSAHIISAHGTSLGDLHMGVIQGERSYESLYRKLLSLAGLRVMGRVLLMGRSMAMK